MSCYDPIDAFLFRAPYLDGTAEKRTTTGNAPAPTLSPLTWRQDPKVSLSDLKILILEEGSVEVSRFSKPSSNDDDGDDVHCPKRQKTDEQSISTGTSEGDVQDYSAVYHVRRCILAHTSIYF